MRIITNILIIALVLIGASTFFEYEQIITKQNYIIKIKSETIAIQKSTIKTQDENLQILRGRIVRLKK